MQYRFSLTQVGIFLILLLTITLVIGTLGFHYLAKLDWATAFQTAALHATGLGPPTELKTSTDKIFSAFYALFSVTIFVGIVVFFVSEVFSRVLYIQTSTKTS